MLGAEKTTRTVHHAEILTGIFAGRHIDIHVGSPCGVRVFRIPLTIVSRVASYSFYREQAIVSQELKNLNAGLTAF